MGSPADLGGFASIDADDAEPVPRPEDSDAMRLFMERAHAARPDLDLANDVDERRAALQLCTLLDGIPLAIELAAARVRLLPPTRLSSDSSDRSTWRPPDWPTCPRGSEPCGPPSTGASTC